MLIRNRNHAQYTFRVMMLLLTAFVTCNGTVAQVGGGISTRTMLTNQTVADTLPFYYSAPGANMVNRNVISGKLIDNDRLITLSLADSLLLNFKTWVIDSNSQVSYSPKGVEAVHLRLSRDSSAIALVSREPVAGSAVDINLQNLALNDLAALFKKDSSTATGTINGKFIASDFNKWLPAITGAVALNDLTINQQQVGNLQLNAEKVDENSVKGTISLTGKGNEASLQGVYFLNNANPQINASLDIARFQLGMATTPVKYLNNLSGTIKGKVDISGKLLQPEWNGSLGIDSGRFTLNQLGTSCFIPQQQIMLKYPAVGFKQFIIRDSLGNQAMVDGNLLFKTGEPVGLDLRIQATDFALINATKAISNNLYGYAAVNTNLTVTGNKLAPVVKGDIYLTGKTNLTLVLPEKNTEKDAAGAVVRFTSGDSSVLTERATLRQPAQARIDFQRYINQDLVIHVDKKAALTILLDPTTGDELKMYGAAKLNTGTGPDGNPVIAGTYQLDSGYYELNYQFLRKRFNLMQGSSIVFNGYPADARININAEYIASTSPKELLGNEVGAVSPLMARSFNTKIPFHVILSMNGSLKNPSIVFDIRLPAEENISTDLRRTIENKLVQLRSDMAATNKQVFALLVLERFVGEQSTDFFKSNGNGAGFAGINGASVSRFLSDALDEIASDLFKGINIDLNLNSYQDFITNDATQKADLGVEVSKSFLDDRLSVTVGKTFGIESQDGSAKAAKQKGSRFLPDVTVNYKLSKDGRYMLRSYNKDQLEVILDGYVVETGLAFIVTMDYDKYDELFVQKNKKENR